MDYNDELYHYGVKGMKWGVRRYQNKDGSLTNASKKRYADKSNKDSNIDKSDLVKKLATRNFDTNKKQEKLYSNYETEVARLEKTLKQPTKWWDADGHMTKEASDYTDAFDKAYNKFNNKERKLWKERDEEERNLRETIFLSDDVKPLLIKAKEMHKSLDNLYDETVGVKSKAYKDAYEKYAKKYGNDPDYDVMYGFDHYYWPSSQERKQAFTNYENKSTTMQKQYNDLISNAGKKVTEGFSDQKISDDSWFDTYEDWGRNEVDDIIRFDRINIK